MTRCLQSEDERKKIRKQLLSTQTMIDYDSELQNSLPKQPLRTSQCVGSGLSTLSWVPYTGHMGPTWVTWVTWVPHDGAPQLVPCVSEVHLNLSSTNLVASGQPTPPVAPARRLQSSFKYWSALVVAVRQIRPFVSGAFLSSQRFSHQCSFPEHVLRLGWTCISCCQT
jgi:hypothetical protein